MGGHPNTVEWLRAAAERDAPVIERLVTRLERMGRDANGWRLLLLKIKRQAHVPYREE